jgi:hypothetical protein
MAPHPRRTETSTIPPQKPKTCNIPFAHYMEKYQNQVENNSWKIHGMGNILRRARAAILMQLHIN